MTKIHPSAVIEDGASLSETVEIGAFCHVGPNVVLGDKVVLHSHVVVGGRTQIGDGCALFPFTSIGLPPQDLKYRGEPSELIIGSGNVIREHVTMNPGTEGGGMVTRVGNNCLFMSGTHVAHDCIVGDHVIMANNATLGGHVTLGNHVIMGGLSACHQFVRVGAHAMVGGMSGIEHDLIPYGLAFGNRARLTGLNLIGLKRRGFSRQDIQTLRTAYRLLFANEGTLAERLADAAGLYEASVPAMDVIDFMREESSRQILQPRNVHGDE